MRKRQKPRYRESDRHGAPSCVAWPVKTMWPIGNFVLQCWAETVYCRCDGNRDDSTISDQNWIKNREAAASRFTLPRLNWQNNQRMNEPIFAPLLFASLSFLDSFFPSGLLLRKKSFGTTLHVVSPCYLSGFKVLGWFLPVIPFSRNRHLKKTQTGFQYFVHLLEVFLHIFANERKEESLATPFFLQSIPTFWSSIWSSTVEVPFIFLDLCRFSLLDVPPSGSGHFLPFRVPA